MAQRRWARTLSVLLGVVLWLCLGLALPIVMSLYTSELSRDAVEAAPGDSFAISRPIALSDTLSVKLERGTVAFVDGNGNVLPFDVSKQQPGPASQNVRLFNASLVIGPSAAPKQADAPDAAAFPVSPFADALMSGRYETMSLRRSTIVVAGLLDEPETLTEVKAEVSLRRRGLMAVKGQGQWRGLPVAFDASLNVGQAERKGSIVQRMPLKLSLKGAHIDLTFDGRMSLSAEGIGLQGQSELSAPSGRGLARWFGAFWPGGSGLRDLAVRGQLSMSRSALAFENAVVRMDGNEGTGVLGLLLKRPRPTLTGTLAYKTLDVKPYLTGSRSASEGLTWTSFAADVLTVPFGMNLDTDLRISADRVQVGTVELGRMAATVAMNDGRLLADVADLKFNGGEGGGQITADFTSFSPKVTVRGKLDQVDLALLSGSLAGSQILQGRVGLVADLVGTGFTLQELAKGLAGKISLKGQSAGKMNVDLKALAAGSKDHPSVGWTAATRGTTAFDGLDLKLILKDGTILTDTAELRTPDASWTAVGVVNLSADRIDLKLSGGSPSAVAQGQGIELYGPLHAPRIKAAGAP